MNKKRNAARKRIKSNNWKRVLNSRKTVGIITMVFLLLPFIYWITLFATEINQQAKTNSNQEEELLIHADPNKQKGSVNKVKQTANPRKEREADQTKIKGKKVYLTFDDGPSQNTEKVLDILDQYNVKATFFVIGKTDEFSKKMYKEIYEKGHTLAMHSYTHQYDKIYKTIGAYKKDLTQLRDLLFEVTGEKPKYLRFPGGSSNSVSKINMEKVIRYVDAQGLTYFDWNVINGDATGRRLTKKQMIKNVISGVKTYDNAMVLMHDSAVKDMTVETLPTVLKKLKKMKVNILPINDTTVPVQHIPVEKVRKNK